MDALSALPIPTVALIHGHCLGGGLELALACRYRVASNEPETLLGLPEIRLGIHPGFGGTGRLTRMTGPMAALNLMLTGRKVSASHARRMGFVDHAVPKRHLEAAAKSMLRKRPKRAQAGLFKRLPGSALLRPVVAWMAARKTAKHANPAHYPAPGALIQLWRRFGGSESALLKAEGKSAANLLMTPTARQLTRLFFLRERLSGLGRSPEMTSTTPRHFEPAQRVHVIGAGVMGGDIAAWCARQGLTVTLQDAQPESIAKALTRAKKLFEQQLKSPHSIRAALDRLIPDPDGHGASKAHLVVEAVSENLQTKRTLLKAIEPMLREDAILATNTSSITLEAMTDALEEPSRLAGLHFFNPVAKMPLVEVVSGPQTDPGVIARLCAFCRRIKRLPLPVKSAPGFLINRLLMPYMREAIQLFEEGTPAPVIDQAAVAFGMPMGPLALADTVGLDICLAVMENLYPNIADGPPRALWERIHHGHLGRKSGQGFYHYGRRVYPGTPWLTVEDPEITDRLILPLINEGVACLRRGVIADIDLVDAGMVFGAGFAPFRGGPMTYAAQRGATKIQHRLNQLAQRYGNRFTPDEGWNSLPENWSSLDIREVQDGKNLGRHSSAHRTHPSWAIPDAG